MYRLQDENLRIVQSKDKLNFSLNERLLDVADIDRERLVNQRTVRELQERIIAQDQNRRIDEQALSDQTDQIKELDRNLIEFQRALSDQKERIALLQQEQLEYKEIISNQEEQILHERSLVFDQQKCITELKLKHSEFQNMLSSRNEEFGDLEQIKISLELELAQQDERIIHIEQEHSEKNDQHNEMIRNLQQELIELREKISEIETEHEKKENESLATFTACKRLVI